MSCGTGLNCDCSAHMLTKWDDWPHVECCLRRKAFMWMLIIADCAVMTCNIKGSQTRKCSYLGADVAGWGSTLLRTRDGQRSLQSRAGWACPRQSP